VVETGGLENRCTGNRTGGSNPSPSATTFVVLCLRIGDTDTDTLIAHPENRSRDEIGSATPPNESKPNLWTDFEHNPESVVVVVCGSAL
jgi:hypothetical protein